MARECFLQTLFNNTWRRVRGTGQLPKCKDLAWTVHGAHVVSFIFTCNKDFKFRQRLPDFCMPFGGSVVCVDAVGKNKYSTCCSPCLNQ